MKRSLTVAATVFAAVATTVAPAAADYRGHDVVTDGYTFHVLGEKFVSADNLSGIDYRASTGEYSMVTDDTARVHTAALGITDTGFSSAHLTGSTRLREADGSGFPQGGEAVRVDPADGSLLWAGAGKRDVPRHGQPRLADSAVVRSAADGTFVAQHPAAPNTAASTAEQGIRDGLGISGLTLNTGGTFAISALAAPLLQDGPKETAPVRISFANRTTGAVLSQLAYQPDPAPWHGTNGLTEILAVDASRYLVLERAKLSNGRYSVRLFEASTIGARSVLPFPSLVGATFTPMQKRLLVDLGDLDLSRVGNFEGMAWGPTLASGARTLVLVSDNDCGSRTQLVALAVTLS